jgi:large subunit ribosomal protein L14e
VEINQGPDHGKLAVIVDIVDQARALVDGPAVITGVQRQTIPYRHLSLTHIVVPIQRSVKSHTLARVWKKSNVEEEWNKTSWARKLNIKKTRASLGDFDRFKVQVLKKRRNLVINREAGKLKRQQAKKS